ncbi:MAG: hypothetical protein WBB69_10235 [Anaerolineales bacterium]
MILRKALLVVLVLFCLSACAQATTEPPPSPTQTSELFPSATPSPIPTQLPSIPERWREYEIALAQSMIPSTSTEEVICEWEVLGESENELYVWAVCTTTFPYPQTDDIFPGVQNAAVIHLGEDGEALNVNTARDGTHFEVDVIVMLPASASKKVLSNTIDYKRLEDHLLFRKDNPFEPPLYALDALDAAKPAHTPALTPVGLSGAETATPLSDLTLTWEDVYTWEDTSGYDSNIRAFFEDKVHYIVDRSDELDHRCKIECIKQVWSTEPFQYTREDGNEYTYFRKVTIIVMLAENNNEAASLAESMMVDFRNYSFYASGFQDQKDKLIAPLDNTEIMMTGYGYMYDLPGFHMVLVTSRGPVALLVLSYNPPSPDKSTTEMDLIIEFANVQLYKLEQAGW